MKKAALADENWLSYERNATIFSPSDPNYPTRLYQHRGLTRRLSILWESFLFNIDDPHCSIVQGSRFQLTHRCSEDLRFTKFFYHAPQPFIEWMNTEKTYWSSSKKPSLINYVHCSPCFPNVSKSFHLDNEENQSSINEKESMKSNELARLAAYEIRV
jgi:hypothetical protein